MTWIKKRPWGIAVALLVVAAVAVSFILFRGGPARAKEFATLHGIKGVVEVQDAGAGAFQAGSEGDSLSEGDTVRTGHDSQADIEYFDGSLTRLDEDTTFTLTELASDPDVEGSKMIGANQSAGSTYNRIQKLTDSESRVEVDTPTATASVQGTSFAIRVVQLADGTKSGETWCITGVCVVNTDAGEEFVLHPGEGVAVDESGHGETFTFDPNDLPAWILGTACELGDVLVCPDESKDKDTDVEAATSDLPFTVSTTSDGTTPTEKHGGGPGGPVTDTTPPTTNITSGPNGNTTDTGATFTFQSSEANSTFECSLDGSPFSPCSSPQSYGALGLGDHTFQVRATDPDGNTDPNPATWTWTILAPGGEGKNHAPDANRNINVTTSMNTPVTFTLTANDPDPADRNQLVFEVVNGPNHGTFSGTAPTLTYTPNQGFVGSDTFSWRATDPGGLDSGVIDSTIHVREHGGGGGGNQGPASAQKSAGGDAGYVRSDGTGQVADPPSEEPTPPPSGGGDTGGSTDPAPADSGTGGTTTDTGSSDQPGNGHGNAYGHSK